VSEPSGPALCVVSGAWRQRSSERAFVVRALAGAATRRGPVTVLTSGPARTSEPDGAFDVIGLGVDLEDGWVPPQGTDLAAVIPDGAAMLIDAGPDFAAALGALPGSHRLFALDRGVGSATVLGVVPEPEDGRLLVGLHVPVNPLAAVHRHNGFGQVGYVLVLSDGSGEAGVPPDAAAWITAGFYDADVVVVERAVASLWRGRALRGETSVDSRTDLWRLISHARVCVDTAPGPLLARECVEAMRFGTPVIVPATAPAAASHARAAGGLTYAGTAELLDAVARCRDDDVRSELSARGREYADALYGDPAAFCTRLREALDS